MMTVKETEWFEIRKCGSYIQNIKKKKIKKKKLNEQKLES